MQLTSRKRHLLLQYVHTHVFLSNNIKEEQGKNDSHPERETNRLKKKKEIQIFVPCCNPPQMEKGLTLNTKISQFLYIKLPLLALVQEYAHFSRELCQPRESLFLTFWFFLFLITTCSSNCPNALCITANMTCPVRFSIFIFFWWTFLCLFVFFFTLQNYTSIHIFSSLNSCF